MMSFTRSIGAVQVLATAPEMPPARKDFRKSAIVYFCNAHVKGEKAQNGMIRE